MKNLDNNELIEQYLRGTLPPEDLQAVESRLAADSAFRAEVDLHRQLHEAFADPKKLELRDLLADIMKDTPKAPSSNIGWIKWTGIALIVLLLGGLGWYWLAPDEKSTQPTIREEIKSVPPADQPIAKQEADNKPSESVQKAPERPIAQVDPAAYTPNRAFENRLSSMIRSSDGTAEMVSPAMGASFKAENGVVKISFRGTAPADEDASPFPLVLNIYDNKVDYGKPLYRILPIILNRKATDLNWTFHSRQRLHMKPGIYYYTIERQESEDLIFAGKFRVE